MKTLISMPSWIFTIITLLVTFHVSHSIPKFQCLKNRNGAPKLPKTFSANIKLNFLFDEYTVEMQYATKEDRELIEFKKQDRHVKYITRKDQKSVLFIQYKEDEHPTCVNMKTTNRLDFIEDVDAGENRIVLKALEVMSFPYLFDLYSVEPSVDTGVYTKRYEGCLLDPKMNISISFAAETWKPTHISYLVKDVSYPEMVFAEIGDVAITALFSYFDPTEPADSVFDPPADVYCAGFRTEKKPPTMPNYFSYKAEKIVYESALGIAPLVSEWEVYYDYRSNISRMDSSQPLAQNADLFSKFVAKKQSIIHDFNAGVQYKFDPVTGKCDIDAFQTTFSAISYETTKNNMYTGNEYFWLDGAETSYNGQFPIRGMIADVYTGLRVDPKDKKNSFVVSWYFSTKETRVAENDNMEKNVLLRMYIRPQTGMDKENVVVINFYDFDREEPNAFTYDLTRCFNDSTSKTLVLTFPAIESLKGSEKLTGMLVHSAIKDVTGVQKQRIYLREVIFTGGYMFTEFSLLEESPIKGKLSDEEVTLDDALEKLRSSISSQKFKVNVPSGNTTVILEPEPDGLNVFAGDRRKRGSSDGYKEGSVVALTIGMLILGFVLGGIALNLIISRKYGVSLFQGKFKNTAFDNPLNESSM